jgi:hypothetical protein
MGFSSDELVLEGKSLQDGQLQSHFSHSTDVH